MEYAGLEQALTVFGQLLKDRGEHFEVLAVGGAGLLLLGLAIRPTKDLDLVAYVKENQFVTARHLPKSFFITAKEVGKALGLGDDWINSAPMGLFEMGLPEGFEERLVKREFGALTLYLASRFDQICFKLYAACDHEPNSKHFADLKLLKPTKGELKEAKKWCVTHDVSEPFAHMLDQVQSALEG